MMKSSSSFGLPSESFNDNMSDKEILSDRALPSKNKNVLNQTKKPNQPIEGLDVSFEFLEGKAKKETLNNKNQYNTESFKHSISPHFTNQVDKNTLELSTKRNDKEVTRSTANQMSILGITNLKSQSKDMLNKQQQYSNDKANKIKIIQQNIFSNQTQLDKNKGTVKKIDDVIRNQNYKQNNQKSPELQNRNSNLQNTDNNTFDKEFPTFHNKNKKEPINNDDSYISANSAINLMTGNFDNSFILSDSFNVNQTQINGQRIINNNYHNIVNMRNTIQANPSIQVGYLQKIINNQPTQQPESRKVTPRLNLESIKEMNSINSKNAYISQKNPLSLSSKVQPINGIDDKVYRTGNEIAKSLENNQEHNIFQVRNMSADLQVPSRKQIYQQTISDGYFQKTEGHATQRESNEYFEFNQDSDRKQKRMGRNSIIMQERSYDDSERSRQMRMPNVMGTKIQLQEDIGYLISKNSDDHFQNEIQHSKEIQAEKQSFYRIVDKDPIDIANDYHDRFPCIALRKFLMKMRIIINRMALVIITNRYFETVSIMVIIANSLFLALDDPLTTQQPIYLTYSDQIFQYIYTFEMCMKILGYGFIFNKGAYLRDAWNVLDFVIVISGYISMILSGGGVNLSVLRSFRVIRPLRTISSIQGLRVIVQALVSSLPLLRDTILVLLFFFLIFAIAGVQLFSGALMNRCFSINTGQLQAGDMLCGGGTDCVPGYACGKTKKNPNYGATNFDNIFYAFLQIFQTVTLEGWTSTMIQVQKTVGQWTIIYFIPIVFIGAFFLLNLTLAVIKSKFTEEHNKNKNKKNLNRMRKKPKIYGHESEEDDLDIINQDENHGESQPKLTKVQKKLKEIEENQELSPKSKKILKDKAKLEELMKRIDFAIKEKEVKDKITPRGSSVFSFSQGSLERLGNVGVIQESKFKVKQQKLNYSDIFNNKFFTKELNSHQSILRIDEQDSMFINSPDINQAKLIFGFAQNQNSNANANMSKIKLQQIGSRRTANNPIKEDDQEQSHDILPFLVDGEKIDDKKYSKSDEKMTKTQNAPGLNRTQTINKNKVSPWLGQVFEIHKQPQQEDHPNSARLLMGGFAGIKAKQFSEKAESEEIKKLKREIYEKITKNFNIFEFFDQDNVGDDEYSGDDSGEDDLDAEELDSYYHSQRNLHLQEDELVEILDNVIENSSQQNEPKYHRKSTMATVDTKSFMKKSTFQWKDNLSDSGIINNQPQNEQNHSSLVGVQGQAEQTNFTTHNMLITSGTGNFLPKKKILSRLSTHSPQKQFEQVQPFDEQDEEEIRKELEKKYKLENSFKTKAVSFLKGCSTKKREKRIEIIAKEVELLLIRSKSQQPPIRPQYQRVQFGIQNTINLTRIKGSSNNQSIRAKSEDKKHVKLQKYQEKFKKKEEKMKKRRSKFFAQALKDIGKTQQQILQEIQEKAKSKRFIKLGGGFKTTQKAEKKLLMRSGSLDFDINRKVTNREYPNEINVGENQMERSPSLMGDCDFKQELKKIKEEIHQKNQKQLDDQIPDMDQILKEKKKKLMIKMKNYKFTSVDDIFESRDPKEKERIHTNINATQKQGTKEFQQNQKPKTKINNFSVYQKKVKSIQKRFFEDLVQNEMIDSDDNQDAILNRIEDEYNVDHRSNIHVTGTLSVVINKPTHQNKMLNKNYYDQLNPVRKITTIVQEPPAQQMFILSKEEGSDNDSMVYQNSARSNNINMNQSQELIAVHHLGNTLKTTLRRTNTKLSNGSKRSYNRQTLQRNKTVKVNSSIHSDRKLANNVNLQSQQSQNKKQANESGGITTSRNYNLPRPEALTDKQILRRLNNEVLKSRVFSSIHANKLPHTINRKDGMVTVLPNKKKQKKKKGQDTHRDDEGDDEYSDTSVEDVKIEPDFFIDRDLNYYEQILKAKKAANNRPIDNMEWSGQDIMQRFDPYKARIALESLNKIRIWPKGLHGYIKRARVMLKMFIKSSFIENFMTMCVFANTVVLAIDYYGIDQSTTDALSIANTLFTIVFAVEMFLKILACGIVKHFRDKLNYMDGTIVILSLIEIIFMSGKGALKALRSIRIIRTFRVLRVARLLRGLKSMMNIIAVIQRSISSFIYLAMLLFLFIFIYALLGMQIFGGSFGFQDAPNRYNFDTFNQAFVTSFILLSTENWNSVMFFAFGSTINPFISSVYFISCIFIGNFMLLNLFLAILLDSFTAVEEEDHDTPEKKAEREKQRIEDLQSKEGEDFINGLDEIEMDNAQKNGNDKTNKKKKKKRKNKNQNSDAPINNILDESIEIDLEALNIKKEEVLSQKKILFKGIGCDRALYLFRQVNVSSNFDFVFTAIFAQEMVLKCIAFGFIMDKNSYLRESWNQLDSFIVATSLIDALFTNVNLPIIKILRLLRILRPLRFISHNSSMKTVVVALLSSMGAIFNVGIVVIVVFLMFAILGVNLFAGKLQSCTVNTYIVNTKLECFKARGDWVTYNQNFDNVPRAMITLFVVATQEGWPDLMYQYTDIMGEAMGPKHGASPINAYFFVAFVFIGSFFFMNLFVGVLFMNFEAAQRDEKEALLLDGDEMKWVDMMKMIINTKPEIVKTPKNRISQFLFKHTKPESQFDVFIMICIILNMVQMAIIYEGQSVTYAKGLEIANYIFTAIFTMEVILKLGANGTAYFIPTWHKFDVFVVLSSFFDIILGQLSSATLTPLRVAPQLARILRVLRVSRLFKLLNKYKGLQALIQTITFSLPSLMNVFALLVLVYFIFAVLGVFMFRQITTGLIIDPIYMNFTNFSQALIILLRISTGEDWPTIMYDTMNTSTDCIPGKNCGYTYSPIFFISFVMICSYVMLNLFVLIILQQFELYYLPQDNILQQFREDLDKFKLTWSRFSKEFEGIKIKSLDLVAYFKDLDGNLGMKDDNEKTIMRYIVKMNLESDEEDFIYFNELLFKAMKRIYGKERTKKRILVDLELKTLEKLQKIKEKQQMKSRKNERLKAVTVNPFLVMMYKNMSFKAWLKQSRNNKNRRLDEVEFNLGRESSDEELNNMQDEDYFYKTERSESCHSDEDLEKIIDEESSQHFSDVEEPTKGGEIIVKNNHLESQDLQIIQEDQILNDNNGNLTKQ